jgi:hypothetical protein
MKGYREDQQFLSGTSACRWYTNKNNIPEIKAFQKRYNLAVQFIYIFYLCHTYKISLI